MKLDYKKISNLEFEGIDNGDYPDFCDAYIVRADYGDQEMTIEQLELLNEDSEFIQEKLIEHLY